MWADFLSHFTEIGQLEEAQRMQDELDDNDQDGDINLDIKGKEEKENPAAINEASDIVTNTTTTNDNE